MRKIFAWLILVGFFFPLHETQADVKADIAAALAQYKFATARDLLKPLAEKGDADAQFQLGKMLYYGWGVEEDDAAARELFQKAAEQGHAEAQLRLGDMLADGDGGPQDMAGMVKWHSESAKHGFIGAMERMGYMYRNGFGVPEDIVRSYMWYSLAAARGSNESQRDVDSLARRMTAEQIDRARKLAGNWKPE
jgi:TPR repeat protein